MVLTHLFNAKKLLAKRIALISFAGHERRYSSGGVCRLVGENFFQNFIGRTGFMKKIGDAFTQHTMSEIVIEVATDADDLYLPIHFLKLAKHGAAPEAWQSPIEQN